MNETELCAIIANIEEYIKSFEVNNVLSEMHQLKAEHSSRVTALCEMITKELQWPEEEQRLSRAIGMLHDIGRFQQWQQYQTFDDSASVDHGSLGFQILKESEILHNIPRETQQLIKYAVVFHNKHHIPRRHTLDQLRYLQVIREADRLDILFIIQQVLQNEPEKLSLLFRNSNASGPVTPAVLQCALQYKVVDYRLIRSFQDWFVLYLGWIENLTYASSRNFVLRNKIFQLFVKQLDQHDTELHKYCRRVHQSLTN